MKQKLLLILGVICLINACALGPVYQPPLQADESGLDLRNYKIYISNTTGQFRYVYYDGNSSTLYNETNLDLSSKFSKILKTINIDAEAYENKSPGSLNKGEAMIQIDIDMASITANDNLIPFIFVLVLVGNILPTPIPYKNGVHLKYNYKVLGQGGKILFQSDEKYSKVYFKDYYVWPRVFANGKRESKIVNGIKDKNDKDKKVPLHDQVFLLIVEDLFKTKIKLNDK